MTDPSLKGTEPVRLIDRLRVRWCAARLGAATLTAPQAPRSSGDFMRGQQIMAGEFVLPGEVISAPGRIPFHARTPEAVDALHGFDWLDDLASLGDAAARRRAQAGVLDWAAAFGRGAGPGWVPGLAGRRSSRLVGHALFLMQGLEAPERDRLTRLIALHAEYLAASAARAIPGLLGVEAHLGHLEAALALKGLSGRAPTITSALVEAAGQILGPDGSIASRNPEELLALAGHLGAAAQALVAHEMTPPAPLIAQLDTLATALRVLRHADGGLARFQGGGCGAQGALDDLLGICARLGLEGAAGPPLPDTAMGYLRLACGRCSVLIDAAPPPGGPAARQAHASTLAFELTSNRRPLIVSCGDGREISPAWHRASRATASHSTLSIDGYSSARFARGRRARQSLGDGPRRVDIAREHNPVALSVVLSHDGYRATHGLEHWRRLTLSRDGRSLSGSDWLVARAAPDQRRFAASLAQTAGLGVGFVLRFHLHPEAEASLDMNGRAVSVALRSGEIWVFRAAGLPLALQPSVYLEKGQPKPRPSLQIVLSSRAREDTTQIDWSLAKAQDTPLALRDLVQDDPFAAPMRHEPIKDMT